MESRYMYVQCRLCLYRSEFLSDIFEDNGRKGFTAADVINDLLQIKVSRTDGYPQLVCLECLHKLMSFRRFKEKCQKAKSKFEKVLHSDAIIIHVKHLAKSNLLATDIEVLNTQAYNVLDDERDNENTDIHEETLKYGGENNASKFGEVVKVGLEEFLSEEEVSQNGDKTIEEESGVPYVGEIKEELIISNSIKENSSVASYQDNDKTVEEEPFIPYVGEIKEEELIISNSIEENSSVTSYQDNDKTIEEELIIPYAGEIKEELIIGDSITENSSVISNQCNTVGQPWMTLFECNKCHERFFDMVKLNIHIKGHSEERVFPCDVCGRTFKLKSILAKHKNIHTSKKSHWCNICNRTFDHKAKLRKHILCHNKERLFGCNICDKKFYNKSGLITHKVLHIGEGAFSCEDCGKRFRKKTSLTLHTKIHTGVKPFHCNLCDKKFMQKGSLDAHKILHNIPMLF